MGTWARLFCWSEIEQRYVDSGVLSSHPGIITVGGNELLRLSLRRGGELPPPRWMASVPPVGQREEAEASHTQALPQGGVEGGGRPEGWLPPIGFGSRFGLLQRAEEA